MLPRISSILVVCLFACSGTPEAGKDGKPAAAGGEAAAASDANGPALVGAAAAVDGVGAWSENKDAGFTVQVPSGDDWKVEKDGATKIHSEKLNMTILLQHQAGIEQDRLDEFATLILDSNKRDAPKYSSKPLEKGSLAGSPAARLDGEFDNGTAFATRDYMVMAPKGASAIMVRGPKPDAARARAIADHIAATFVP